jgi:hypothetical protein
MATRKKNPLILAKENRIEAYFSVYFGMGATRSIRKLSETLKVMGAENTSTTTLERYSRLGQWQERIQQAYQRAQEEIAASMTLDIQEANLAEARLGRDMRVKSGAALAHIDAKDISPAEAVSLGREGVKMERLALGLAITQQEVAVLLINEYIHKVMTLYIEVNEIEDPEERLRAFTLGADQIASIAMAKSIEGKPE